MRNPAGRLELLRNATVRFTSMVMASYGGVYDPAEPGTARAALSSKSMSTPSNGNWTLLTNWAMPAATASVLVP